MNIFGNIFGKKKEPDKNKNAVIDTVHKLRYQVDILNKRNKHIRRIGGGRS